MEEALAAGSRFGPPVVWTKGDADKAATVYQGMQPMTPPDIAETVFFVATLPRHVNINRVEMMPTMQAFSPFAVHRA